MGITFDTLVFRLAREPHMLRRAQSFPPPGETMLSVGALLEEK
jgi:hypothetical protein